MGGQPKALLPFKGRPMAGWGIEALAAHCDRVLLSTAQESDLPELGLPTVPDRYSGAGPLGGLHAGLLAAAGAPILVLACDLPLIRAEDLAPLVAAAPGSDVVLYQHDRGIEPLVAWYGPGSLPAIEALVRGGGGRIRQLFERVRTRYLPWRGDPGRLANVNTPSDLAALEGAAPRAVRALPWAGDAPEPALPRVVQVDAIRVGPAGREPVRVDLAPEVPFTIVANGTELATLMCSPTDLRELCCGFLLSSGLIRGPGDLLAFDMDDRRWAAEVALRRAPDPSLQQRRIYTSGCGRGVVFASALEAAACLPVESDLTVDGSLVAELSRWLLRASEVHARTSGVHTAAISVSGALPERAYDDVGRHNAVDKAIGRASLEGLPLERSVLLCSGRTSSEVLHKARYCGIPIVVSSGSPSHQAVLRAAAAGLTLIGSARGGRFTIFTHPVRIAP